MHEFYRFYEGHLGIVRIKACARSRATKCTCGGTITTVAFQTWARVHHDFVGVLRGWVFLAVIDGHSKWPEIAMLKATICS